MKKGIIITCVVTLLSAAALLSAVMARPGDPVAAPKDVLTATDSPSYDEVPQNNGTPDYNNTPEYPGTPQYFGTPQFFGTPQYGTPSY